MNTLDFLNAFRPDGTHLLTSIPQNGGQTITAPFCDDDDEMMSWIGTQQGQQRNVYFSVNPVIRAVAKKAGRDNIAAMEYLHVDLDLPAGTTPETLEAERAKLLAQLTTDLPDGVPTPTFVVDSGGGYWGFWRLTDPFQINGDETLFEEAKRYNQQLELLFGADACHNVDRIARLPGLMNYPNKKKVAMRGEDPLPTAVVQHNPDAVYSIRDFRQAPKLQGADRVEGVEISGNIEYADDFDARFPDLSERVKTVIVQRPRRPREVHGPQRVAVLGRLRDGPQELLGRGHLHDDHQPVVGHLRLGPGQGRAPGKLRQAPDPAGTGNRHRPPARQDERPVRRDPELRRQVPGHGVPARCVRRPGRAGVPGLHELP
jgi:hypothetical protein